MRSILYVNDEGVNMNIPRNVLIGLIFAALLLFAVLALMVSTRSNDTTQRNTQARVTTCAKKGGYMVMVEGANPVCAPLSVIPLWE